MLALVAALIVTVATPAPPPDEYVLVTAVEGPQGLKIITPEGTAAPPDNCNVVVPAPDITVVPGITLVPVAYQPLILLGVILANVIEVFVPEDTNSLKSLEASERLAVDNAVKYVYAPEPAASGPY
jgi:hypothetical protein